MSLLWKDAFIWSIRHIIFRKMNHSPLIIMMYHRFGSDNYDDDVPDMNVFIQQIEFIRRYFYIISLEQYFEMPLETRSKISNPISITIDDGYSSFKENAYPIFTKYSIPATIYLPFNFIDKGSWMWQDKNKYILMNTSKKEICLEWNSKQYFFSTQTLNDILQSRHDVYSMCMKLDLNAREEFSLQLAKAADVDLPIDPTEEFCPLSWNDIREMENNGIFFGSHTMNHEILTQLDPGKMISEVRDSKKCIEDKLGHTISGFCYPNGEYNDGIAKTVKDSGYLYSVTTQSGYNYQNDDTMKLRRIRTSVNGRFLEISKSCFIWPWKSMVDHK